MLGLAIIWNVFVMRKIALQEERNVPNRYTVKTSRTRDPVNPENLPDDHYWGYLHVFIYKEHSLIR